MRGTEGATRNHIQNSGQEIASMASTRWSSEASMQTSAVERVEG